MFTVLLLIACVKLWYDQQQIRRRIVLLEVGLSPAAAFRLSAREPGPVPAPAAPPRTMGYVFPWKSEPVQAGHVGDDRPGVDPSFAIPRDVSRSATAVEESVMPPVEPAPRPVMAESVRPSPRYEAEEAVEWIRTDSRREPRERREDAPFTLEGLFGRTLPIWAGGITLAIAGILVVKWSIDMGLLAPGVRIVLGILFGLGLIGGAETTLRGRVADDRIPQALAGAGIASLYAAVLAANLLYGLIGDGPALLGMVVVSVAAAGLSMRFGAPSAVLGLVGGLAAPALLGGGEPHVALLSVYVAMVSGGIAALARRQKRTWLGALSMGGAAIWAFVLVAAEASPSSDIVLGGLMLFLGLGIPAILASDREDLPLRMIGGFVTAAQTAMLVAMGGFGLVQWAVMAIATAGILLLSDREEGLRDMPAVSLAALVAVVLAWHEPASLQIGIVVLIFLGMQAVHAVWRMTFCETAHVGDGIRLVALPFLACGLVQIHDLDMVASLVAVLWGAGAVLTGTAMTAMRSCLPDVAAGAQPLAVAMAVAALAAALPVEALPLVMAVMAVGLFLAKGWRPAAATAAVAASAFSVLAFGQWTAVSLLSIGGEPLYSTALPDVWAVIWSMLPPLALVALAGWRMEGLRSVAVAVGTVAGVVFVHVLWRHLVATDADSFAQMGMLDRTGWEAILAMAAVLVWHLDRRASAGLALASMAHFAWFTLLRYDPLWTDQIVGPAPVVNLVLFSHAVPLALLWAAGHAGLDETWSRIRRVCQMALIVSLGFGLLRQAFAGAEMAMVPVSDAESILRSVGAIALAIGFLLWGLWKSSVEWRAGSLALMLVAVTKVFLFDAAGLDGLARVASFAALGFSLIGVGWLYSRLIPQGREGISG